MLYQHATPDVMLSEYFSVSLDLGITDEAAKRKQRLIVTRRNAIVREVLADLARNLQKFVSHRRRPRPPGSKLHKYHAYKPTV
jgi:hypothetical protein